MCHTILHWSEVSLRVCTTGRRTVLNQREVSVIVGTIPTTSPRPVLYWLEFSLRVCTIGPRLVLNQPEVSVIVGTTPTTGPKPVSLIPDQWRSS